MKPLHRKMMLQKVFPKLGLVLQKRSLFQWINIIFNKVDEDRRKLVGPDRSCAEWLLRNGALVKWTTSDQYLTNYNSLPGEDVKLQIQEVDATDSSIMHYGFDHFKGCNHIRKIIFHKCLYLEDQALEGLAPIKSSLKHLQVSSCLNITDVGLKHLTVLDQLKELILFDLPYVKNKEQTEAHLHENLPQCNIRFNQKA